MTARRAFLKWLGAVPAATTLLPGTSRAALVDSGRGHVRVEDERLGRRRWRRHVMRRAAHQVRVG